MDHYSQDHLAASFAEHRQRLFALAERRLNPILLKRLSAEDVVSETYVNAAKRLDYFASHDDVPVYYKLRTILLQTITDIERRHLKALAARFPDDETIKASVEEIRKARERRANQPRRPRRYYPR